MKSIDLSNGGAPRQNLSYPQRKVLAYLRQHGDVRHTITDLIRASGQDVDDGDTKAAMVWTVCRLTERGKIKCEDRPPQLSHYWYELPKETEDPRSKLSAYYDAMAEYNAPPTEIPA